MPIELTGWFPGSVNPVHAGDYECEIAAGPFRCIAMWKWSGKGWQSPGQVIAWRGLTQPPATPEARNE